VLAEVEYSKTEAAGSPGCTGGVVGVGWTIINNACFEEEVLRAAEVYKERFAQSADAVMASPSIKSGSVEGFDVQVVRDAPHHGFFVYRSSDES